MIDPVTSNVISHSMSAAGLNVVKAALNRLELFIAKQAGRIAKSTTDKLAIDFRLGFSEFLSLSYDRCRFFKTILNPNQPLELLAQYIHLSLSCGSETLTDDQLVKEISTRKHVVVTGLAGSGKSMFMKYATLCKFESPVDGIPLFVDLRKINNLTEKDLLTFIRTSCTNPASNITKEWFDLALKAGAFSLFLDGFDEIDHEIRDKVQKQILELRERFPKVSIVLSSRPDERFGG